MWSSPELFYGDNLSIECMKECTPKFLWVHEFDCCRFNVKLNVITNNNCIRDRLSFWRWWHALSVEPSPAVRPWNAALSPGSAGLSLSCAPSISKLISISCAARPAAAAILPSGRRRQQPLPTCWRQQQQPIPSSGQQQPLSPHGGQQRQQPLSSFRY